MFAGVQILIVEQQRARFFVTKFLLLPIGQRECPDSRNRPPVDLRNRIGLVFCPPMGFQRNGTPCRRRHSRCSAGDDLVTYKFAHVLWAVQAHGATREKCGF